MSRWTHVAGIVRVDALIGVLPGVTDDKSWMDSITRRLQKNPPTGSEGPVRIEAFARSSILETSWGPDKENSELPRGFVAIWGDLRDFGEREQIESVTTWLNTAFLQKIVLVSGRPPMLFPWVREAIVVVVDEANENSCRIVWSEEEQEEQFEIVWDKPERNL